MQPGAGVIAGIGAVAQEVAQIAAESRDRANQIRLNEAEVEARRLRTRILLDPKAGVLNRQRQAAFDAPEVAGREWDAGVSKIAQSLNPDVRVAFLARAGQIRAEIEDQTFRHVRREMDVVDKETTEALTSTLLGEAVDNAANDVVVTENLARAESLIRERLARQDITDPVVVEAELGKVRSAARVSQIDALLRGGNVQTAEAVFKNNREAIEPDRRERVAQAIAEAKRGDAVAQAATRILAASDRPTERNQMIAELPIEMREGVRALVDADQKAEKDARELEQETAFARLETAVQEGVPLTDPRLAPDVALLSVSQRRTLEQYTTAPVNDNKAWLEWYQMSLDPKNLATMTESQFRSHWARLSTSHRDDAERAYREAKQTANAPESARSYITPQTIVARAMRTLGGVAPFASLSQIPPAKQPLVAQFETAADEELAAEKRAKRRDLSPSEMQAVVDRMQLQFVRETPSVGFNLLNPRSPRVTREREEARGFQMTPSDTTGIFAGTTRIQLSEIPVDQLPSVDNLLRANNVPLTNTNREALYTIQQFDTDGSRTRRWLNENRR